MSQGATVRVKKNTYSVPARLIGEMVEARVGAETIEVWYAGEKVQTMERLRGTEKHRIDYRHVIEWLARKPGAFARYVYREDLYPSVTYRRAYDALARQDGGRADKEYVRILELAWREGEAEVEKGLQKLLEQGRVISVQAVRGLLGKETPLLQAERLEVPAANLSQYDELLESAEGIKGEITENHRNQKGEGQ